MQYLPPWNKILFWLGAAFIGYFAVEMLTRSKIAELRKIVELSYESALSGPADKFRQLSPLIADLRQRIILLVGGVALLALATVVLMIFKFNVAPFEWLMVADVWPVLVALVFGATLRAVIVNSELSAVEAEVRAVLNTRASIYKTVGDDVIDRETIVQHARVVREEDRFSRNLGVKFELKMMELANVGIFQGLTWNLEPDVNVLLGRNGYGKSFLLRVLVAMVSNDAECLNRLVPPDGSSQLTRVLLLRDGEGATIERKGPLVDSDQGKIPVLAMPDSRFMNRARSSIGTDGDNDYADLARHGAHHFLRDLSYDATIQTVLAQMCIDALEGKPRGELPSTPQLDLVARLVRDLSGEGFRFYRIEPAGSARFSILVETDSSPGRPISIQQASQGTLSVVAMCALIYQFLRRVHPDATDSVLCEKPGIVVIDEVDAHLHPAWQRKIVHLLRTYFPAVQFILTAHSPLVVAGCGTGEVSVLRRQEGRLSVLEFQRDFIGARPEDIYREVFEVEERDAAYVGLQAQLPQLPRLKRELNQLKNSGASGEEVRSKEQTVNAIVRTRAEEEAQFQVAALQRENAQLKRQLNALRDANTQPPA